MKVKWFLEFCKKYEKNQIKQGANIRNVPV